MKTQPWAMILVVLCTALTSSAQIFWKFGADRLEFTLMGLLTNWYIFVGIFLYGIAGIMLIVSFRGGEVSTLYPIIATSYIWVSFLSIYFLGEIMTFFKWLGVFTIVAGIVFIGFGSSKDGAVM